MVTYKSKRIVNLDGQPSGYTNEIMQMEAGTHVFDLGTPANYTPVSVSCKVTGTTELGPMKIEFS